MIFPLLTEIKESYIQRSNEDGRVALVSKYKSQIDQKKKTNTTIAAYK